MREFCGCGNGLMLSRLLLLFIFFICCCITPSTALQVYNNTDWTYVGNFTDGTGFLSSNLVLYHIYKPLCQGRYKLGDLVTRDPTNPGPLYMCIDGPSDEVVEANIGKMILQDSNVIFVQVYSDQLTDPDTKNPIINGPLGQVGVNSDNYYSKQLVYIPPGGSYYSDETRGYGAFVHPKCRVVSGDSCNGTIVYSGDDLSNRKIVVWNGLQPFGVKGGNLFQTTADVKVLPLPPVCLPYECLCPNCVYGTCLFPTGQCLCDSQWTGENCNIDVDECASNIDKCDAFANCINESPGYRCECYPGYTSTDNGRHCFDIDECALIEFKNNCTAQSLNCTNTPGSFVCTDCESGFIRNNNGTCVDVTEYFLCGNSVLNDGEQCDRGLGCNSECKCSAGFSPGKTVDCIQLCGNGVLDASEECDGGTGCSNVTCRCNTNLGYRPANDTSCTLEVIDVDACAKYSGDCSKCAALNCLYCNATSTCSTTRISSDCLSTCGGGDLAVVLPDQPPVNNQAPVDGSNLIVQVVPSVVIGSAALVAGAVVLVVLMRRHKKRKARNNSVRMSVKNSLNTSKYGIERTTLGKIEYKPWEPPANSEYVLANKLPFDLSKQIDFNVGRNQFKVGQKYTDVITLTSKDKKGATQNGISFAFHGPTTSKVKLEFNPSSGIVKKGKPVEVEVSMTLQMTTELDVDIGVECSSEKKHAFTILHLMGELSSFIDLEEVVLEGGSSAKPIGDGAFGVVYKGKYRGQDVAVKMLKVQDMPEEMLDEFDREVDLMNKLRHKNIVQFIGASKVVGRFALVTEFIEKGNVANVILKATKPVDFALKVRFALDAARAMLFLHENRVLHRDLKLDNLLCVSTNLDDPVLVKLTDFGTSRAVSEKSSNQYTVGVGTPMYMSPEILSKKPYDTKSDVFSYGVTLWILYCQKEPYQNIEHSWEIARFIIEGNREKIPKDCPSDYARLIEECWSQDPDQRPDFQQIVERLEKILQDNIENPMLSRSRRK